MERAGNREAEHGAAKAQKDPTTTTGAHDTSSRQDINAERLSESVA